MDGINGGYQIKINPLQSPPSSSHKIPQGMNKELQSPSSWVSLANLRAKLNDLPSIKDEKSSYFRARGRHTREEIPVYEITESRSSECISQTQTQSQPNI